MEIIEIEKMLLQVIEQYVRSMNIDDFTIDSNTQLIGSNSMLDSVDFVGIVVDIEAKLLENNIEISLLSDKAMSEKRSPFMSIKLLSSFIKENGKISK